MSNRIYRFFIERYGVDDLYYFNLIVYLMLFICNIFLQSTIILVLEGIIVLVTFCRALSKNIVRRRKENNFYLKIKNNILKFFILLSKRFKDRHTHMYKKCRYCKTTLRLPLKKGNHTVKCPNCQKRFDVKCRRDEKIKVEVIKKKGLKGS